MATLSLCMIVKNEEDCLDRCLTSAFSAMDEIIIVDTGSTDNTRAIAESFGAKLYDFEWIDDFSAARNFAFSKASADYIIWLDADDILKSDDLEKLKALKKTLDGNVKQVAALYNIAFDENDNPTVSYYRERIFKNDGSAIWSGVVHECVPRAIGSLYADFAVSHAKLKPAESGRNLRIYSKLVQQRKLIPRELYYYGRELFYNNFIEEAKEIFLNFLDTDGWYINKIDACMLLSKCWQSSGNSIEAKKALVYSFIYGEPTAAICCELGKSFMVSHEYKIAIYWYSAALTRVADIQSGEFVFRDDFTYIPALQLCVCYDKIGDRACAESYNNLAASFKPSSSAVEYNKNYFARLANA